MANIRINVDDLERTIEKELTVYHDDVIAGVKKAAQKNMRELVTETKAHRYKEDTGAYRKAISSRKLEETQNSLTMQWYVKAPHYRLTHLLEHGHATRNGGRTVAYGNLGKSSDKVIKQYEKEVVEVIENG